MRKLSYICLIFLLFSLTASARMSNMIYGGQTVAAGTTCPDFYADANVTFSWDGNHGDGVLVACDSAGGSVTAADNGLATGVAYSEAGDPDIGALWENNANFKWTTSGDSHVDNEIGTIWVRQYQDVSQDGTGTTYVELLSTSEYIRFYTNVADAYGSYNGITAHSTAIATGWKDIAYAWNHATGEHDTYAGAAWEGGEGGEIGAETITNILSISLGCYDTVSVCGAITDNLYMDKFVIMSTYKAALPPNW